MTVSQRHAQQLCHQLEEVITGEVHFDRGSRALYATDASLYRQLPVGVVIPRTEEDVRQVLALCRGAKVPVLPRGAGTSLAGQCCNTAVILDFSKYLNRIIAIDPQRRLAKVQPGCVLDKLRNAAETWHLTFGPDPSTHSHNCLGGMLGNNSCGVHSIMAGRSADNVRSLRVLTYDGVEMVVGPTSEAALAEIIAGGGRRGEIYAGLKQLRERYQQLIHRRYPTIPRRVSGYNLDALLPERGFNVARALVGSEGSCVTILEAELELVPSPPVRSLLVVAYEDVYRAGDNIQQILDHQPIGLEGIDHQLLDEMKLKGMHPDARDMLPGGGSWLFIEFGGDDQAQASAKARALMAELSPGAEQSTVGDTVTLSGQSGAVAMRLLEDPAQQQQIWLARKSGLGASSRSSRLGDTWPGWEDAAVPPAVLGDYLRDFRQLLHRFNYEAALYGHFGDGCIHCRINFDMHSEKGIAQWRRFMYAAAELVVHYGGSLSGEHGDGQLRGELLPKMLGPELVEAMREFKSLWDPQGMMNPGKVVDPYPMTRNLREDPARPLPLTTSYFAFSEDRNSFARAADRCVGIGECRRSSGGVMCPSYRGTGDEQHSTRGRARLLFEMLQGQALSRGWRDTATKEAMDLCLACKGCKSDCPVGVDMATLKAEFMAHYYRRRLRPRSAYAMGLIWWWSRAASRVPRLANFLLQTPGVARVVKYLGGIARHRQMPHYAKQNFRHWFARRQPCYGGGPRLMLWPDTFNNYFFPQRLQAAVTVLEAAGYQVEVPAEPLCCGRPLYAEGMLDLARHQLRRIVTALEPALRQGVPVIGLEPSCVVSFRDELPQLLPGNELAQALAKQSYLFSEFLHKQNYWPPRLTGRALVHLHCHQHAVLDTQVEQLLLQRAGLEVEVLDAGCCGMAGSFGYSADNYALSLRIADQQLAPALRREDKDSLIVTNGFSCDQQIRHCSGRPALHIAEVLARAVERGDPATILASTSDQAGGAHAAAGGARQGATVH